MESKTKYLLSGIAIGIATGLGIAKLICMNKKQVAPEPAAPIEGDEEQSGFSWFKKNIKPLNPLKSNVSNLILNFITDSLKGGKFMVIAGFRFTEEMSKAGYLDMAKLISDYFKNMYNSKGNAAYTKAFNLKMNVLGYGDVANAVITLLSDLTNGNVPLKPASIAFSIKMDSLGY